MYFRTSVCLQTTSSFMFDLYICNVRMIVYFWASVTNRTIVRFSNLGVPQVEIDCLVLFLFSFLNFKNSGGLKPPHPPSNDDIYNRIDFAALIDLGLSTA